MLLYIIRRLGLAVLTLAGIVVAVFMVTHILPGNPALVKAGGYANAQTLKVIERQMGLNRSLAAQFGSYVGNIFNGSLGTSYTSGNTVAHDLITRLPATAELAVASTILATIIGVPLGVTAGLRERSATDWAGRIGAILGTSIPLYWLGLVLMVIFYATLHLAPAPSGEVNAFAALPPSYTHSLILDSLLSGNWSTFFDALQHLALPAITLGIVETAPILKITRSATLEVARSDYVRTARAYGLSQWEILKNDVLRNVATRVLTALGIVFGFLLGGSILVERIYDWPGIGLYAWNAVTTTDYNAIQGYILMVGIIYLLLNLAVDLLYAVVDPRIRFGTTRSGPRKRPRPAWPGRRVISLPRTEQR
ncbi:MAG TPA: ABC transporter permease [Streptosporangiaceae bacterium]|nr:ABC transporter permease [Streptosporangiaceae bacterium]